MRTWQSDEMAVKSYVSSKPVEELGHVNTVKQEWEYCETVFFNKLLPYLYVKFY